jgi:hypothetical protein
MHLRTFNCFVCGCVLARDLRALPEEVQLDQADGHALLPQGTYRVSLGKFEPERPGDYLVNLADLQNTEHHSDPHRLNGCCGLDGLDGYNLVCANGHEVGTERSDCWLPHHAVLSCAHVKAAEAKERL